jgi:SAM-dependent methyltransferase
MIRTCVVLAAIPNDHARQVDAYDMLLPLRGDGPLRFLDLGAGDGRSFDKVREIRAGVDWIGLDIASSPEVRSRTRTDCTFITYDGVTIPFPDQHFDVVFSRQVFEHVRYPEKLLQEIRRVLRPGGSFIGSVSQLEPFHSRSYWNFTYMGFASIASEAGLRPVELRPGIDGFTLTLRNFALFGVKAKNTMFHQYFKNASPLNLLIDALLQPEAMNAADLAEFVRLKGFVSEYFPSNNFAPKIAESASLSIQDINRIKLQYAGHICFRFSKN